MVSGVHRGAGRIDENGGDRATIHGRAVDAQEKGQADDGLKGKSGGQENGNGDRSTHPGQGTDDDATDRAHQQGDNDLPLQDDRKTGG